MNKPKFNPNAAFEPADTSTNEKPKFNPNAAFEPAEAKKSSPQKTSTGEAVAKGFADSATFGFGDEIEGAIGGVTRGAKYLTGNTVGDKGFLDAVKTGYKTDRDATRAYDKQLRKDSPIASVGGGLLAAAPALGAKGAISIGNMIGQGAIQGYGGSDEEDLVGQAKDTAIGGGISGALGGAAAGLGKGANYVGDFISDYKNTQALKALGAQKAQMKRMGGDYGEDVSQYAIDKGLINPLTGTAEKQLLASQLKNKTGQGLEEARSTLPDVNQRTVLDDIMKSFDKVNLDDNIQKGTAKTLQDVTEDLKRRATVKGPDLDIGPSTPNLSAKDLIDYKSSLFNAARNPQGAVIDDNLEKIRRSLGNTEVNLAEKAGTPELKGLIKEYSMNSKIEELLKNRAAMGGNSVISAGSAGGGVIGGVIGGPIGAAAGAVAGSPFARAKAGETAALGINAGQKALNIPLMKQLVESGKLDPRIYAYIISRQQ